MAYPLVRSKSLLVVYAVFFFIAEFFSCAGVEGGTVVLGKDDLTGKNVAVTVGKTHPFVAWTKEEVEAFDARLSMKGRIYDGARYSWKSPTAGVLSRAAKGDPLACGKVWQVNRDPAMARKASEYLLEKAASFKEEEFLKNEWKASAELQTSALAYDLVAESPVLTNLDRRKIRAYMKHALYLLKKLPSYGMVHNMGVGIDCAAWTAALCLEDVDMLSELFQRFKKIVGEGILPGGYWYEGVAYGNAVRTDMEAILERTARSGIDLAHLHCKRMPLSPKWSVENGYIQAGSIFEWPFHVVTPFMEVPNIADGDGPHMIYGHSVLSLDKYVNDRKFLDMFYIWELKTHKDLDAHVWGDFPPDPDVPPLERLGDAIYPEAGIFALRQGTGLDPNDQYVLFLGLPRTGFHMHSDQGHIDIARYGRWLTGDVESSARPTGYQSLRNDFSATRWAHNTVVVGGNWGKTEIDFPKMNYVSADPSARFKVVDVTFTDFTNGLLATDRRRVLVADDFIIVTDDLASSTKTTFDWFFHGVNNAKWSFEKCANKKGDPFISYIPSHSVPDYDPVWDKAYETEEPWQGRFLVDRKEGIGLKIWQMDVKDGRAVSGHLTPPKHGDPGIYAGEKLYLVCQRKTGKEAHFTVVLEPFKGETKIKSVELTENSESRRTLRIFFKDKTTLDVMIDDRRYSVKG
jgi:hypothetical protein